MKDGVRDPANSQRQVIRLYGAPMGAVALLLLLLLLAPPAISQTGDDSLVVPGQRIGRYALTMTIDDIGRRFGRPPCVTPAASLSEADLLIPLWQACWGPLSALHGANGHIIVLRAVSNMAFYKTAKGIGIASPLKTVLAAYGRPAITSQIGDELMGGITRLVYDEIGLTVRLNSITETVIALGVYRPGTARTIWKLPPAGSHLPTSTGQ